MRHVMLSGFLVAGASALATSTYDRWGYRDFSISSVFDPDRPSLNECVLTRVKRWEQFPGPRTKRRTVSRAEYLSYTQDLPQPPLHGHAENGGGFEIYRLHR